MRKVLRCVKRVHFRFLVFSGLLVAASFVVFHHGLLATGKHYVSSRLATTKTLSKDATKGRDRFGISSLLWPWKTASPDTCPGSIPPEDSPPDISTPDVYPTLNMRPSYKTYWNKTFEARYLNTRKRWDKLPLKVIVIPHSHNDPGWLRTFDNYFLTLTSNILDNMLEHLTRHKDLTFIWAEIAFFSKWWKSLKDRPHLQEKLKKLVAARQMEMVTGGWVMTDEATAHIYAVVDQLIEGHQWLKTNLGVVPTNGWSIDPFGHSSTIPYVLKASGIKNTVILRTHYAWKQYLAETQRLDFMWRQIFASSIPNGTDILCHMAPFDLYSIKHTCGPDANVCLQFDFRKVSGEYSESRAVQITEANVREKAELLLGQYGRIGSLFPHNVVLVPLGDDFRFNKELEWDQQYRNYKILFDYINSRTDWHAEVGFGTVDDYFSEVRQRMVAPGDKKFPSLSGDFFPYGDIYSDGNPSYWTGYYTTRPFWKQIARDLERWLRSAEILYTISRALVRQRGDTAAYRKLQQDYSYLTVARESLALFQHHDAITGTSKEMVMQDYGKQMHRGLAETIGILSHSAQHILIHDSSKNEIEPNEVSLVSVSRLSPDVEWTTFNTLPRKIPLSISDRRKIVLFNSEGYVKQEAVVIRIRTPYVKVLDSAGSEVPSQINPVWNGTADIAADIFSLVFVVQLSPLSLTTYTVVTSPESSHSPATSVVSVFIDDVASGQNRESVFRFQNPIEGDLTLSSNVFGATFSKSGLLKSLEVKSEGLKRHVVVDFQAYKSRPFRSGAYLFQPDHQNPVKNVTGRFPVVRVVRGPIVSEITIIDPPTITLVSRVYHVEGPLGSALEMESIFDISTTEPDVELFMRFESDVSNGNTFFTDSNGFQMQRRKTHDHLPLEANYYPLTSAAYLEDSRSRLSLLVSHAHGCASLHSGWLEVMLDRRIRYDDSRGLSEGVMDNKKSRAKFWLLLEKVEGVVDSVPNLSLLGHVLTSTLNYPAILLAADGDNSLGTMSFLDKPWPSDMHLLNFRTIPESNNFHIPSANSLLILQRKGRACHVKNHAHGLEFGPGPKSAIGRLTNLHIQSVQKTSLTGLHAYETLQSWDDILPSPPDLVSYNVTFVP